jgi:cell division septum initiation protein DivIVA
MTQEAGENKMLPTDREEAWAEYARVVESAQTELDRAKKAAWVEYARVIEAAEAEHERVIKATWAKLDPDKGPTQP